MPTLRKIRQFWKSPWLEKTQSIEEFYWALKTRGYYRLFFGKVGKKSKIIQPMRLKNVQNIYLHDDVIINKHAFLLTLQTDAKRVPSMIFGSGSVIGHMNHITCVDGVTIGQQVLTADRVYISDHSHDFSDPRVAIIDQAVVSKGKISIGDGTWIGENAVILCCTIGKHCVIGANAVVLQNVPDYCIVAGIPARVVKRFNPGSGSWERVEATK
jgi:acetyltransferase-like isoleucine patch superfamily enzyme